MSVKEAAEHIIRKQLAKKCKQIERTEYVEKQIVKLSALPFVQDLLTSTVGNVTQGLQLSMF